MGDTSSRPQHNREPRESEIERKPITCLQAAQSSTFPHLPEHTLTHVCTHQGIRRSHHVGRKIAPVNAQEKEATLGRGWIVCREGPVTPPLGPSPGPVWLPGPSGKTPRSAADTGRPRALASVHAAVRVEGRLAAWFGCPVGTTFSTRTPQKRRGQAPTLGGCPGPKWGWGRGLAAEVGVGKALAAWMRVGPWGKAHDHARTVHADSSEVRARRRAGPHEIDFFFSISPAHD